MDENLAKEIEKKHLRHAEEKNQEVSILKTQDRRMSKKKKWSTMANVNERSRRMRMRRGHQNCQLIGSLGGGISAE